MAADQTLVNAAFALGRSNVPGDYSAIFNKQYEGLIASQNARYKMYGDIAKTAGEVGLQIVKDNKEANERYDTMTTDYISGSLKNSAEIFDKGSPQNSSMVDSARNTLNEVKNQIEALQEGEPSRSDKNKIEKLYVKAKALREVLNQDRALNTSNMQAVKEELVNYDASFGGKGSADYNNLSYTYAALVDPNADHAKLGIRVFRDKNMKLMVEYSENTGNLIYKEASRNEQAVAKGETEWTGDDTKESDDVQIPSGPKKVIAYKDLAGMLKMKDRKSTNIANGIIKSMGTKDAQVSGDFSRIEIGTYDKLFETFISQDADINFLATTPQTIQGNSAKRTFKKDLVSGEGIDPIDIAVINQLGIGSDKFTAEELKDGKIDPIELAAHEDDKKIIIEKLTNPQTQSERKVAAGELAGWWTSFAKQEFDDVKKKNEPDGVSALTKGQQNKKNNLTTFINGNAGMYNGYNVDKENLTITSPDGKSMSPQEFVDKVTNTQFAIDANTIFKGDWSQGSAASTETVTDPLNSNVYYETGEGGKINGGLIQDAYNKYASGESFSTYDDSFTFTPKGSGWTVTGPTQDPKTKEFTGPVTTRSTDEEEMVKKMGFKKQASRLGFEGIKEKTAATNPITDYKKEGDKWYYIKGGQKKEVDASNFERLEAQTLIALARGKK